MLGVKRREFITLLGGAAAAWPLAARAQQPGKLPTIGFLGSTTPAAQSQLTAAFVQRLRELGWVEGHTVTIEYRWAEGRSERFAEFAAGFVRLKVDVILTHNTPPVLAAKQATSVIPIVFATPVSTGLAAVANTIGITDVACFAARTGGVLCVRMTSTFSRTNSAANSAKRSLRPSAQRYSIVTVRPSIQPRSRSRCTKAAVNWRCAAGVVEPKNPMVGSFPGCCARAASGHAAAAPPMSVMKSRRLMSGMGTSFPMRY